MRSFLYVLSLTGGFWLLLSACQSGQPEEPVEPPAPEPAFRLMVLSPAAEAAVPTPSDVEVAVEVRVNEGELHWFTVRLYPVDDFHDRIIDYHGHVHDSGYRYSQRLDLSGYASGTVFRLEARACGAHGCHESQGAVEKRMTFSIP